MFVITKLRNTIMLNKQKRFLGKRFCFLTINETYDTVFTCRHHKGVDMNEKVQRLFN
jgi:hypothetical protein